MKFDAKALTDWIAANYKGLYLSAPRTFAEDAAIWQFEQCRKQMRENEEPYLRASNAILKSHVRLLKEHVDTLWKTVVPIAIFTGAAIGFFGAKFLPW